MTLEEFKDDLAQQVATKKITLAEAARLLYRFQIGDIAEGAMRLPLSALPGKLTKEELHAALRSAAVYLTALASPVPKKPAKKGRDYKESKGNDEIAESFLGARGEVTEDEDLLVSLYAAESGYFNGPLRRDFLPAETTTVGKRIRDFDAAINARSIPQDTLLFRGVQDDSWIPGVGDTFGDLGYTSTSLHEEQARKSAVVRGTAGTTPALLRIKAQAGQKGMYLEGLGERYADEFEVLLPRGTRFRVDGISVDENGLKVYEVSIEGAASDALEDSSHVDLERAESPGTRRGEPERIGGAGQRLLATDSRPKTKETPPEVKKFLRERLRNHLRGDYEATMRKLAAGLASGTNVSEWHKTMEREQRAYIARMMTAGVGRALIDSEIDEVNRLAGIQQGFLTRFAGEVSARREVGRPHSLAYLANRHLQYGGVGWGAWFRGNEKAEARGDGYVIRYIAVDDPRTCSPCSAAEAAGPYLPGAANVPYPGEICRGHGLCRCRQEVVFDMDAWRELKGKAEPVNLPLRKDATEHERELQRIRREKRKAEKELTKIVGKGRVPWGKERVDTTDLPLARGAAWNDLNLLDARKYLLGRASRTGEGIDVMIGRDALNKMHTLANDPAMRLDHPHKVYFGLGGEAFSNLKVGDTFNTMGARSTTDDLDRARRYADEGGTLFEVELPVGSLAIPATVFDMDEIVLLPGARFEVTAVEGNVRKLRFLHGDILSDGVDYVNELYAFRQQIDRVAEKQRAGESVDLDGELAQMEERFKALHTAPKKEPAIPEPVKMFRPAIFADLDKQLGDAVNDPAKVIAMQRAVLRNGTDSPEFEQVRSFLNSWMEKNRLDERAVRTHGLEEAEMMTGVLLEGVEVRWTAGNEQAERAAFLTLANMYLEDIVGYRMADALWKSTRAIYFTDKRSKDDAYWGEKYKDPDFRSAASGGDGSIMVYSGRPAQLSTLAHEAGHNLATEIYGRTNPFEIAVVHDRKRSLVTTEWGRIIESDEPPVSKYAAKAPDEDFAEAMGMYVSDKRTFASKYPKRFALTEKLLRGEGDAVVVAGRDGTLDRLSFAPSIAPLRAGETEAEARERRRLRRLARKAREAAEAAAAAGKPVATMTAADTAATGASLAGTTPMTPEEIKREKRRARRAARKAREAAAALAKDDDAIRKEAEAAAIDKLEVERKAAEEAAAILKAEEARKAAEEAERIAKARERMRLEIERKKAEMAARTARLEAERLEAERIAAEKATAEAAKKEADRLRKLERRKERRAEKKAAAAAAAIPPKLLRPVDVVAAEIAVIDAEVARIRSKRLAGEVDTPAEKAFMDTRRKELDILWKEKKDSEDEDVARKTPTKVAKGAGPKKYRHVLSLTSEATSIELEKGRLERKRRRGESYTPGETDFLLTADSRLADLRREAILSAEEDKNRAPGTVTTSTRAVSGEVKLLTRPPQRKIDELAERVKDDLRRNGVDADEAVAAFKELVMSSPAVINTQANILNFWRSGEARFKSQFETGTSMGANNQTMRAKAENKGLGYSSDPDVERSLRPIYGAVNIPGNSAASYGGFNGLVWKVKEEVRARMTVTFGDSLYPMGAESVLGTPMVDPGLEGIGTSFTSSSFVDYMHTKRQAHDKERLMGRIGYIEWQCQGQLALDDIEYVEDKGRLLSRDDIKWIEDRGVKVIH